MVQRHAPNNRAEVVMQRQNPQNLIEAEVLIGVSMVLVHFEASDDCLLVVGVSLVMQIARFGDFRILSFGDHQKKSFEVFFPNL